LSSGYSQGAGAQLELLAEGLDPALVYDGHLIQMIGLACFKRDDVAPHFGFFGDCSPLPTNGQHAPVIVLASEADMLIFHPTVLGFGKGAFFTRNPSNPNWRQYEMAGISHLPEPILPLGLPNQNTGDARPIFRAALENLTRWTNVNHSESPPPSRFFRGSVGALDTFVPITDRDGHFAGGVRLPHVESTVRGRVAGAPLGRHTPLNPLGLDPFNLFVFISGTFTRFSDDELLDRYRSQDQYVSRVRLAADHLAATGYITNADRMALIAAAEHEPLPEGLRCPR
jgi:Alpha/beta hydrolase domain